LKYLFSLNKYFLKYKKLFLLGILFTLLSNYFRILSPQVAKFIIDAVVNKLDHKALVSHTNSYNFLVNFLVGFVQHLSIQQLTIFCGALLLVLAILGGFFMFLMRQTIIVMSRHIEFDQKNELFKKYQSLDVEFLKTNSTGDLMNRISEDVSRVRMYTGPSVMYIINLLGTIGFSLYFMFKENALLSLYVISPLPILAIIIYYVNNIINHKSEQQQQSLSTLTTIAQESYSGIRVIQSFVQEKMTSKYFNESANNYKQQTTSLAKVEAMYFPSITLLIGLSTIIAIYMGCKMHFQQPNLVTAGTITEFIIYVNMLTFPVSAIGYTASMVQRAAASQKRLNEFLNIVPTIQPSQTNETKGQIQLQSITLDKVSFTYPHSGIQALNHIHLTINKTEKIFILGNTGSGKTTLALLLQRMYDASDGDIFINDTMYKNINLPVIRNTFSYVPQDVFLFSDSIANNIAFGASQSTTREQIIAAAQLASVAQDIEEFERKYDTVVGERGITLSGGQKQRISMARAFLKEADCYIFDDCLSAVDNITEKRIAQNLSTFLQHKAALFISHRIIKALVFDKIVVLQKGTIVEQGTHQQLMLLNGYYASVYNKQME
jgi:ATP-binding cassette, subfamily B, multidrug efflux pump